MLLNSRTYQNSPHTLRLLGLTEITLSGGPELGGWVSSRKLQPPHQVWRNKVFAQSSCNSD